MSLPCCCVPALDGLVVEAGEKEALFSGSQADDPAGVPLEPGEELAGREVPALTFVVAGAGAQEALLVAGGEAGDPVGVPLERAHELDGREVQALGGVVGGAGGEEALRVAVLDCVAVEADAIDRDASAFQGPCRTPECGADRLSARRKFRCYRKPPGLARACCR